MSEALYVVAKVARTSRPARRGDAALFTRYGTVKAEKLRLPLRAPRSRFLGLFTGHARPGTKTKVQVYGQFK